VIRLLVVDDHPAIASAIEAVVRGRDGVKLVAAATTTAEAAGMVGVVAPDVVVCDLWLDGRPASTPSSSP
jgi:DNA-binding NarL/FixJ family response regulator